MSRSIGFGPRRLSPLTWDTGFSSKNLKRLFPTDQSMVVVIDDRSDVWGDIPNLVKVVPCELHCDAPSSQFTQLPITRPPITRNALC